jgi:hypothetical protein
MTSFRAAACTRVMHWNNTEATNLIYPTNKVMGERDTAGALYTYADTRTATRNVANKAAFLDGSNKYAVIHSLHIHKTGGAHTVSIKSFDGSVDLVPSMDASAAGETYNFGNGLLIHGGFALQRSDASIECTLIWSLLEN